MECGILGFKRIERASYMNSIAYMGRKTAKLKWDWADHFGCPGTKGNDGAGSDVDGFEKEWWEIAKNTSDC